MCPLIDFETCYIEEFTAVADTAYCLVVELCFVGLRSSKPLYLKTIDAEVFAKNCGAVFDGAVQCKSFIWSRRFQ